MKQCIMTKKLMEILKEREHYLHATILELPKDSWERKCYMIRINELLRIIDNIYDLAEYTDEDKYNVSLEELIEELEY